MLTNPVRAEVLSQGHHLKEEVPRQRTLDTRRNPYVQKRLGTSPGPFDPESDSSSKPFLLSA